TNPFAAGLTAEQRTAVAEAVWEIRNTASISGFVRQGYLLVDGTDQLHTFLSAINHELERFNEPGRLYDETTNLQESRRNLVLRNSVGGVLISETFDVTTGLSMSAAEEFADAARTRLTAFNASLTANSTRTAAERTQDRQQAINTFENIVQRSENHEG